MEQYRGKHFETRRFFTIFPDFAHLWNLNTDITLKLDDDKKFHFMVIVTVECDFKCLLIEGSLDLL